MRWHGIELKGIVWAWRSGVAETGDGQGLDEVAAGEILNCERGRDSGLA